MAAAWLGRNGLEGSDQATTLEKKLYLPYLWSRGLKKLDVVALTHADHDHLDGLYAVLDNFQVGSLWVGDDDARPAFKRLLAEAKSRGVTIVHQAQGAESNWHGALVDVLWPPHGGFFAKTANDNSLVLRLSDDRIHFLLTGDIEQHARRKTC